MEIQGATQTNDLVEVEIEETTTATPRTNATESGIKINEIQEARRVNEINEIILNEFKILTPVLCPDMETTRGDNVIPTLTIPTGTNAIKEVNVPKATPISTKLQQRQPTNRLIQTQRN